MTRKWPVAHFALYALELSDVRCGEFTQTSGFAIGRCVASDALGIFGLFSLHESQPGLSMSGQGPSSEFAGVAIDASSR